MREVLQEHGPIALCFIVCGVCIAVAGIYRYHPKAAQQEQLEEEYKTHYER